MVLGVKPQTTTAYHPQANGMVVRFHCSLKTALKARLDGPRWMDELPIVMLGIRTTWKEDLDAAPVLLTYGTNLRVPGDFLPPPCADKVFPSSAFVQELQEKLRKLSPFPPSHHGSPASYIAKNLQSADQVYLRHDARKGPLVRPYDGPFPVLTRADKHFDMSKDGKAVRVSLDRLKPACSPQTFPRLSQDPCVSEQQDPHALQEVHTAIMGDAVGPDRVATSDDAQGIAPAPAPSSLYQMLRQLQLAQGDWCRSQRSIEHFTDSAESEHYNTEQVESNRHDTSKAQPGLYFLSDIQVTRSHKMMDKSHFGTIEIFIYSERRENADYRGEKIIVVSAKIKKLWRVKVSGGESSHFEKYQFKVARHILGVFS